MPQLALHCGDTPTAAACALCGRRTDIPAGTHLRVAATLHPVCPECGRAHAPSLAALVGLAAAAERVGRIGRHSVFPPLTALLDLAGAAEQYTRAADAPLGKAG